jgi:hypothetical protein
MGGRGLANEFAFVLYYRKREIEKRKEIALTCALIART